MRIAAFGFRSIPLRAGCAGADKFAAELFPRLVAAGHSVVAYNRLYPGEAPLADTFHGVSLRHLSTVRRKGFDTLLHSLKATWDIIRNDTADVVHVQNGGNSIFALPLRLAGKKVFISQDGVDWKRDKWPWYARLYLRLSGLLTAWLPTQVIFDNVFVRDIFRARFRKPFEFIPFGSEVDANATDDSVLAELGLERGGYFLFVGRFIPDKGLQYLVPAFEKLETDKKLVLVGGSPNPAAFEQRIRATADPRILFPGFIYGPRTHALMKHAYAYVQPSDVEGLSPVILENMGLATPVICSDIVENAYVVGDDARLFRRGDVDDCLAALRWALEHPAALARLGERGHRRATAMFSWSRVAAAHERVFNGLSSDLPPVMADEQRLHAGLGAPAAGAPRTTPIVR
ncbi:MAG: glycosyltransferase family 4 protein [Lautropia sp.]